MTKIRVMLDGGDYCDVTADLLTFDDDAVVLWAKQHEIGRYSRPRVTALDLSTAVPEAKGRSAAAQERLDEIRRAYPNAYLPWTSDQEEQLAGRYADGATITELSGELGRQPGGIEARLEKLELLDTDNPKPARRRSGDRRTTP